MFPIILDLNKHVLQVSLRTYSGCSYPFHPTTIFLQFFCLFWLCLWRECNICGVCGLHILDVHTLFSQQPYSFSFFVCFGCLWTECNICGVRVLTGKITLVCLGPLTNLALALRLDPQMSKKLKEVFILGGNIEGGVSLCFCHCYSVYILTWCVFMCMCA